MSRKKILPPSETLQHSHSATTPISGACETRLCTSSCHQNRDRTQREATAVVEGASCPPCPLSRLLCQRKRRLLLPWCHDHLGGSAKPQEGSGGVDVALHARDVQRRRPITADRRGNRARIDKTSGKSEPKRACVTQGSNVLRLGVRWVRENEKRIMNQLSLIHVHPYLRVRGKCEPRLKSMPHAHEGCSKMARP